MEFAVGSARSRAMGSCVLILVSFALSGCGVLTDVFKDLRDTATAKPAFNDGIGERPFNLATDCMPGSRDQAGTCILPIEAPTGISTYQRISSLQDPLAQVLWRNRFQDFLIWRSENQCQIYKSSIIATQNGVNFGLNTLTTGTAGVAAIVLAPAANILGGIAAISNGIRGHFNEDFYQRFVAPAIINQIDTQRRNQLVKIMLKRGIQVDTRTVVSAVPVPAIPTKFVLAQDYTLEESIGDAERYHQLCSATVALAALLKDDIKFDDTATGLKARLGVLSAQLTANTEQIKTLVALKDERLYGETIRQLTDANNEIAKQIAILQRQMLTAPATK